MPTISKTLLYKRARFEPANDELTLQNLLEKVYDADGCRTAQGRFLAVGSAIRAINFHGVAFNTMQVGTFVNFEPGRPAQFISRGAEKDMLDVPLLPPDEHSDYLQNTMYFGIQDNDVVLIQSGGLTAEAFEEYLQWLIKEKSEILDADSYFILDDYLPADKQEKVRYLELNVQAHVEQTGGENYFIVGNAATMLQSLLPSDAISLDKLGKDSIINAKIRLTVQKRPKTDDFDLLDDIADSFRNVEGVGYTFETTAGMRFSNLKNFRMSKSFALASLDNSTPNPDAVWEAMYKWLDAIGKM